VIKEKTMNFKSLLLSKKSFTLIELFIVIVILVIISGGVIYLSPKLIIRQRLKNNAWQILNDIREVQERARSQLESLRIEFNLNTKDTYRYELRKNGFETTQNLVIKSLDKNIYLKSIKIGDTIYSSGVVQYMYDEWGVPKKIDNNYIDGGVLIIIETPNLKNSFGENLSVEINVSPGTGTLRMVGPK
jgi:type II secretory pathway pseudopilin PulG